MEFPQAEQAEQIRASVRAGLTTAQAVAKRYSELTLDSAEGAHRAAVVPADADPDRAPQRCPSREAQQIAALLQRSADGWAPTSRKARA